MLHLLFIFAFAAPHMAAAVAAAGTGSPAAAAPWWAWGVPWVVALLAWGASHVASARAEAKANRGAGPEAIEAAHAMMRHAWLVTVMSVFATSVFTRGELPSEATRLILSLPALAQGGAGTLLMLLASLGPVLLVYVLTVHSFGPCDRRLHEATALRMLHQGKPVYAPLSNWQLVAWRLRSQAALSLVPIAVLTCSSVVFDALPLSLFVPLREWFTVLTKQDIDIANVQSGVKTLGAIVAAVLVVPHALRFVWGAVPIASGALQSSIVRVLKQHNARALGPLAWPCREGETTAWVVGAMWPSRYLVLTTPLLESLRPAHLEAAVAHEVAHIKLRHVAWLPVASLAGLLGGAWLGIAIASALREVGEATEIAWLAKTSLTQEALLSGLAGIGVAAATVGFVSRRFEWQADAFAVRHLSRQELACAGAQFADNTLITAKAAYTVRDMLQEVCEANAMDPAANNYMHGSIETRQARVLSLVGQPSRLLPIDRVASLLKVTALVALLAAAIPIGVQLLRGPTVRQDAERSERLVPTALSASQEAPRPAADVAIDGGGSLQTGMLGFSASQP